MKSHTGIVKINTLKDYKYLAYVITDVRNSLQKQDTVEHF